MFSSEMRSFTGPWVPPHSSSSSHFLRPWPAPDLRLVQCLFCDKARIECALFLGVPNWRTLGAVAPFLPILVSPLCSYLISSVAEC